MDQLDIDVVNERFLIWEGILIGVGEDQVVVGKFCFVVEIVEESQGRLVVKNIVFLFEFFFWGYLEDEFCIIDNFFLFFGYWGVVNIFNVNNIFVVGLVEFDDIGVGWLGYLQGVGLYGVFCYVIQGSYMEVNK